MRRLEHKAFSSGTPLLLRRASTAAAAATPSPVSVPLALCQIHVGANKAANLRAARAAVVDASNRGGMRWKRQNAYLSHTYDDANDANMMTSSSGSADEYIMETKTTLSLAA